MDIQLPSIQVASIERLRVIRKSGLSQLLSVKVSVALLCVRRNRPLKIVVTVWGVFKLHIW